MSYNNSTILSVKNLTVTYDKYGSTVKALDNLTLEPIAQGSWTFLIGSNGSGKSTLFKTITKNITSYTGTIEIAGTDIKKISSSQLSKHVFLINQNPLASTVDELTVWENLLFAINGSVNEKFEESLKQAGLLQHKNHLAKNLSGGQRQLLALQIARLRKVKLLLLDEPFAALDPVNMGNALKIIIDIQESGTAIFFISHDMEYMKNIGVHNKVINLSTIIN